MATIDLRCGDCMDVLKTIHSESVDLVLTDPPYNIGVKTKDAGRKIVNDWDRIDNYVPWSLAWLTECQRILKPNGVLYFFHNDMAQIAELMQAIRQHTRLQFVSFCIWDKGDAFRAQSWHNRDPHGAASLRSWFNVCEYVLHYFNAPAGETDATGLERIYSDANCFRPLKEWYAAECARLHLTAKDIGSAYTAATGKKPYMLRHYFQDSQFEIPTEAIYNAVYVPLGFARTYEALRAEYEALRAEYEALRAEYEALRNVHNVDPMHCNIWHIQPIPSTNRLHTCQKPVDLLRRLIRVSSNPGATVLDCFMGSGSTGEAAVLEGRDFIGIERDPHYFDICRQRIEAAVSRADNESAQLSLLG